MKKEFDVAKQVRFPVPAFQENELDKYFLLLEKLPKICIDLWTSTQLYFKLSLKGKTSYVYTSMSVNASSDYGL